MNLMNILTEEDKTKIQIYYDNFSLMTVKPKLSLDEYLRHWADSKKQLYTLLGNQLIYKIPLEYGKTESELSASIKRALNTTGGNLNILRGRIYKCLPHFTSYIITQYVENLFTVEAISKNTTITDLCLPKTDNKKAVKIPVGTKICKALGKLLRYYDAPKKECESILYDLGVEISLILNDKTIKGNLCISIHPLDFMTSSDNNSNWSSCLNWQKEGCYKIGTLEMMNANNVVICYLESNNSKMPLYLHETREDNIDNFWNNKKWRQLFTVNKTIICSLKAYPFQSDTLTKLVLEELKNLAKTNLHWKYSYGPELYNDMKFMDSDNYDTGYDLYQARGYNKKCKKIYFETKGMYNDILNSKSDYWCYRNYVPHAKTISLCGKVDCLYCGNQVLTQYADDSWGDYNERYVTDTLVCEDCDGDGRCDICNNFYGDSITELKNGSSICPNCCKEAYICAKCQRPHIIDDDYAPIGIVEQKDSIFSKCEEVREYFKEHHKQIDKEDYPRVLNLCSQCTFSVYEEICHYNLNVVRVKDKEVLEKYSKIKKLSSKDLIS